MRYLFGNVIGVLSGNLGGFGSRFQKSGCTVLFIVVGEKAAATLESILPDARNGVGDDHRGKAAATLESIPPYACNGAGDDNRGKAAATIESTIPDACNGVFCTIVRYLFGNVIGVLSGNLGGFGSRFQKSGCPVLFIVVGEKAAATVESTISYACNGAGDDHRGKAAATIESTTPYARNCIVFFLIRYLFGDVGGRDFIISTYYVCRQIIAKPISYAVLPYCCICQRGNTAAKQHRQQQHCL